MKLLTRTAIVLAFGLAAADAAFADEGPGGRTFEVTRGDVTYTSTFGEDGSYSDSLGGRGAWSVDAGQLCVSTTDAQGQTARNCAPYVELDVGESATIEAEGGAFVAKRLQ